MNDIHADRIDEIFQAALDLPAEDRESFVERACASEEEVCNAVKRLLVSHDRAEVNGFIKSSMRRVAERLVIDAGRLPNGSIIGKYKVVKFLGEGGMGEVYLAEDRDLGRTVALKLLSKVLTGDVAHVQRFEQEARAASALNHQNILTVYDIGRLNNAHFIAAEFVEGQTLRQRISHAPLDLQDTLKIGIQIATALAAAHKVRIVHRDIKPENIMIRSEDGVVKVLDFGLAKSTERGGFKELPDTEAPTKALVHTAPGVIIGTAAYMSPEQARGIAVDERTDIWSLGVVLYEMATGRLPFAAGSADEIIAAIQSRRSPVPLTDYAADVPPKLDAIIRKALNKEREERYQLVKDLQVDLEELKQWLNTRTKNWARNSSFPRQLVERFRSKAVIFMLTVVLITLALAVYYAYFLDRSANAITSVAVLPLVNVGGDPEMEYLSDGLSESLINSLSQLPGLKVIARSSAFKYKGKEIEAREVARALGVDAILNGRVVQRGDTLVISFELVDARDNSQIWGQQYQRKATEVLGLQSIVSREIASRLRLRMSKMEQEQLAKYETDDPRAFEFALKSLFYRRKGGTENQKKSIEFASQAVTVDPNYALAYAELSESYRFLAAQGSLDPSEYMPKGWAAACRALELNENLADAHFAVAQYKRDRWEWLEADNEYRRAVELNPNLSRAHSGYANLLSRLSRHTEAIAEAIRARELDPLGSIANVVVGRTFFYAGKYDDAISAFKKTLELDRNFPVAHFELGTTYEAKGLYREAIVEFEEAKKLGLEGYDLQIHLGVAFAGIGEHERARVVLKHLEVIPTYVSPTQLAILYTALHENEQAFRSLEKAFAARDPQLQNLRVDPAFEGLRSDLRFTDLVRRVGLQ